MTLISSPINFMTADGTPTGYSIGCCEANFILNVKPGFCVVGSNTNADLSYKRTSGSEREIAWEFKPKIEMKAGSEGLGGGGEIGGATKKTVGNDSLEVTGKDDSCIIKVIERPQVGSVQWIITPSPLSSKGSVIQCSKSVYAQCTWPSDRLGSLRLFGRRYVACEAGREIGAARGMLARFIHWLNGNKFYDNMLAEHFKIVGNA